MLEGAITAFIAHTIRFIERWDPEGLNEFRSEGVIRVKCTPLDEFYFDFSTLTICEPNDDVRASIDGDIANLVRYFMKEKSKLSITGDLLWLNDRLRAAQRLDIRFEDALEDMLGDKYAAPIANIVRTVYKNIRVRSNGLLSNVADHLQYDRKIIVPKEQVQEFCSQVDELALSADRIEAKLRILEGSN